MNLYRVKVTIRSMDQKRNMIEHVVATSVELTKDYDASENKQVFKRCIRRTFLNKENEEPEILMFTDEVEGTSIFKEIGDLCLPNLKNNYYKDENMKNPTWTLEYNEFKIVGNLEIDEVKTVMDLLDLKKYEKLSNNDLIELESTL